ncbi:MAG TPA: rhodanese-like domain-containing protein [Anaerolineaceae bacterium]
MNNTEQSQNEVRESTFPRWLIAVFVLALLAAAGVFAYEQFAAPTPQLADTVSVQEAAALREQGVYFVDVRTPAEYEQAHIPDVPLIPVAELPDRLSEIPRDQPVVFVCQSGGRSAQARDIARQAGYENVTSMAGGMLDWQAANLPTVSAK